MNVSFSDMLFNGKRKNVAISPDATVGVDIRGATLASSKRASTTRTSYPRVSKLAFGLDKILASAYVSAIAKNDGSGTVYCEVKDSGGNILGFYYDGITIYTTDEASMNASRTSLLVPFILFTKCSGSANFSETQLALSQLITEYVADSSVTKETLAYYCDCFYYDTKDIFPSDITVLSLDKAIRLQIEQAVRANQLTHIDVMCSVYIPVKFIIFMFVMTVMMTTVMHWS